uniref:Small ribosomal subunit protein uS3c n=1 Tax=Euglena archaeoplastidiata TaxID=1188008 RepID=A0A1X9GCP4_9EUGL|nr:ribosomal protein S3 [Euglena archaeoplastidiata]AKR17915.1 ribosomal protein S3 [Euglena archaeoplastidiata]
MGQKVHPLGFRMGISNSHSSYWFSKPTSYLFFVQEDIFIRDYIYSKLSEASVLNIDIKRKVNFLCLTISVAKPSVVMGVNGSNLDGLRNDLSEALASKFVKYNLTINIVEVLNPDANARFLAEFICQQLEKRVPFRRVIKSSILKAQKAGLKGVKIQIAGRLNGAEIARTEWVRVGQVPLHTLKANIDYCSYKAQTLYGILGIKVFTYSS